MRNLLLILGGILVILGIALSDASGGFTTIITVIGGLIIGYFIGNKVEEKR